MKGKKKWLIALVAALAGVISVVRPELARIVPPLGEVLLGVPGADQDVSRP